MEAVEIGLAEVHARLLQRDVGHRVMEIEVRQSEVEEKRLAVVLEIGKPRLKADAAALGSDEPLRRERGEDCEWVWLERRLMAA